MNLGNDYVSNAEVSLHYAPRRLQPKNDVCSIVSAHGWLTVEAQFSITLIHVIYVSM